MRLWIGVLGVLGMATLILPIFRIWNLPREVTTTEAWPPDLRNGSKTCVVDVAAYRRRLSPLLAARDDSARAYLQVGQGAIVGIDWHRLGVVAVTDPPADEQPRMISLGPLMIDPAVQTSAGGDIYK